MITCSSSFLLRYLKEKNSICVCVFALAFVYVCSGLRVFKKKKKEKKLNGN